ncbi:MAG: hypothetical protein AB1597_06240 [Chloroflexota bacterium]
MNNSRGYKLFFLALALGLASAFMTVPAVANETTVEVNSGTPVIVNEGASQSNIPITIRNIPNLGAGNGVGAFTFKLTWNTYVMKIDAITPADINGWGISASTPDNARGQATIAGFTGANFLVGNATVATLTITGVSSTQGTGAIIMEILDLGDKNGVRISAAPVNGQVQVVKAGAPAPGGGTTPAPANYTLTIAINGGGTVSPAPGSHSYASGTVVNLTATPPSGGQFTGWTGDVANPTSPTTQVVMNANKSITANFTTGSSAYSLTILVSGQGTVSPPTGSHLYPAGTTIELKATAAPGWRFANWSGEVANPASSTTTITINKNITVTASFVDASAPAPSTPSPTPGTRAPSPTPAQPAPVVLAPQPSSGLAVWQIVLIAVGAIAVLGPILYFVLKRFITMRMYRV